MFEGIDFKKAGRMTSVVLRGSCAGVKKMLGAAYSKLEEYAEEADKNDLVSEEFENNNNNKEQQIGDKNGIV